mgnify:CR=1 FL=1
MPFSLEIDQTFIGAILTAIGYSINDKVVIFDRVREFFGLYPKRDKFQLFNDSFEYNFGTHHQYFTEYLDCIAVYLHPRW